MADYLDPEVIAKAQALGVKARTLVEGRFTRRAAIQRFRELFVQRFRP